MSCRLALLTLTVLALLPPGARAFPPDPITEARALLRAGKFPEAVKRIESYLASNRFDGRAWSALGVALHRDKRYDRSIEAGQKAIELGFNQANEMYNIVCAYALLGKTEDALAWLKKALDAGFCDQETLEKDDEIDPLRKDPRFIALTGLNPPPGLAPEKQWACDLDFLARRMEQMHWSLYARVPREAFRAEIDRLKADAPRLSLERVKARLCRLLALVGDGHTGLATFAEGQESLRRIPLDLYPFKDGLYVIGTPEAHRELLGTRVLKIGPLDTDEVLRRVRALCSVDNEMTYLLQTPAKLIWPEALQEIGAATGEDVEYTLRFPDGSTRAVTLAPEAVTRKAWRQHARPVPGYVYANAGSQAPAPLYQRDLNKPLTLQWLEETRAVYFGFHEVAENEGQPFTAFVDSLTRLIKEKQAEHLIIDMRLNTGGDTGLVLPLVHTLIRDDRVNRPGHLFVIIGRYTFSAAQNTVNLLEFHTSATFVGEPTGSRPNFVGESTYLVLPYSKLRVYCSSRYWQHVVSTDHRTWVQPQIAAEQTFADFVANRDPCLEAILARIKGWK